jgi:hypothetical protein
MKKGKKKVAYRVTSCFNALYFPQIIEDNILTFTLKARTGLVLQRFKKYYSLRESPSLYICIIFF